MQTEMMQLNFDYLRLDAQDRSFIKERAARIHELAKRTAESIVLIGQWLSEVKERLGHGQWLPWLEHEFGWSEQTARNFINVYRAFKSTNFGDLAIDVSALYLIAAPKTPDPVRREIIGRAQAGEYMTHAEAIKALEHYERTSDVPTPSVARQIAIATNKPTLSTDGHYVLPMSAIDEKALGEEQGRVRTLYDAMGTIANTALTPAEMVDLGEKHFCLDLFSRAARAIDWLTELQQEEVKHDTASTVR